VLGALDRYKGPEALAVTLSRALDAGADGVLASPTALLSEATHILRRSVPVHVVVPAVNEQDRLELEPGIEPVLQRRLGKGGMRAAFARFTRPASLYGGDWSIRLPVLIETELARVRAARDVRGVVLDAWLADCALAVGNRRFFETFVKLVHTRVRAMAGIETHNLGLLLHSLAEWDLAPDYVVAPFNAKGLGMKPTADEVLVAMRATSVPVLAKELRAGGETFEDGVAWARAHGASGVVADLCELEDAGYELKAVAPAVGNGPHAAPARA